ncbi:GHMP kinase [Flavobacterium sp. CYK-55]|uniref:GYDIA family GHMP kinase n=1 Tax=Flavobacterium sp. CYK-55 TaxID=2835529 RepID=UPI001BCFA6CB|nr:GYDIA family GHMP kinase [Flavobacterium sp. CYK-55]MBS7785882.1 GHMP kinase [Flavobacterium sp. CYK-55]
MQKRFYSNGKLLITSEYLVLDGATALALPTKFGQDLVVEETQNQTIAWTSYEVDGGIWMEVHLSIESIISGHGNNLNPQEERLFSILHQAHLMNPNLLQNTSGFSVETHLGFPKLWGLGSSSTLINNVAQWFDIDAYQLLERTFGGSGYDIACAQHNSAILYRKHQNNPEIQEIDFEPACAEHIYFVYLNQKQDSRKAIETYRTKNQTSKNITVFNTLTQDVLAQNDFDSLSQIMHKHEELLSEILEIKPVQETLFNDFNGTIKSLGGWGGDFVMALCKSNPKDYFAAKGFTTILPYSEMIQ